MRAVTCGPIPWVGGDPHLSPFHLVSYALIGAGFWLIAAAWRRVWDAARNDELATVGPYAHVRHPQYAGFVLIMAGFLLQWPTIPTLVIFPILIAIYRRLALNEEREVAERRRTSSTAGRCEEMSRCRRVR